MIATTAVPVSMVAFPRDDEIGTPDAIVVLGGLGQERADLGIELASEYDVPLVLSSSARYFAYQRGYHCQFGNALCLPRPYARNTAEEARHTLAFVRDRGWDQRIVVVTSTHHTARARLLFRQCLGDQVAVIGAERIEGASWRARAKEIVGIVAGVTVRRAC